ncbi:arylesterase [Agaribacterium haliotis]|uniref:arylesterase n=1 Tax=Agaribacterium haliotis TaxID=2013869 RepID=UPI001958E206|nr:arylesterase [Agaribacterium haliotis]
MLFGSAGHAFEASGPKSPAVDSSASVEAPRLLILGDSLSAAYKLPKEQGWVELLGDKFNAEGLQVDVHNASVSGMATAGGLKLLPNLIKQQPGFVIIELGANDGLQGKSIAYIRQNLEQLVKLAQQSGAQVMLVGIQLPPNMGRRYTEPFFALYADTAKKYDTALVPFLLEGVAGHRAYMMADGLHPNAKGQEKIAEQMYLAIKSWLF